MSYSLWRNWRLALLGVVAGFGLLPTTLLGAERPAKKVEASAEAVEMFPAIEAGQISVKVIFKDAKEGRLLIQNKTAKPLNVKLPAAFGAVPVLAQNRPGRKVAMMYIAPEKPGCTQRSEGEIDAGLMLAQAGGGANRGAGGGQNMMGGGGMGGGMGMFYVAPEKVGQAAFPCVCLEHGKPEPRPGMPYELKPVEQVTDKPEVWELGRMLGKGEVSQRAAQVAAWHLNNNMNWQELAAKRLKFANGQSQPYFSPQEIQAAMQVVATAAKRVEEQKKPASTSAN